MADEVARSDANYRRAVFGIGSSSSETIQLRLDDTTKRLLVDASVSSATITDIEDGAGDSIMDAANNAMQVSIVSGLTQYTEDTAHNSGDIGTMALVVRNDTLAALAGTDGDYAPLQVNASGALYIQEGSALDVSAATVTVDATGQGDVPITLGGEEVTANLGATDNAVLDTIASPVATISSTPLQRVAIFDASDAQITSFGGGTQYAVDAALGVTPTGTLAIAVRDDALTTLTPVEGDAIGLRVGSTGALWVQHEGNITADLGATDNAVLDAIAASLAGTLTVGSHAVTNAGTFAVQATQSGSWSLAANQSVNIAQMNGVATTMGNGASGTGVQRVTLASDSTGNIATIGTSITPGTGATNLGKAEDAVHSSGDVGVQALTVSAASATARAGTAGDYQPLSTSSSNGRLFTSATVDAALPTGTNAIGKVDHVITGIGHGVKTVTTAGTDVVLAASTACKKVVLQAQTDNTGYIAVGASGVDATEATGTGIVLTAGDTFVLQIDNLADIYIDATVNGEGVRYTYFT